MQEWLHGAEVGDSFQQRKETESREKRYADAEQRNGEVGINEVEADGPVADQADCSRHRQAPERVGHEGQHSCSFGGQRQQYPRRDERADLRQRRRQDQPTDASRRRGGPAEGFWQFDGFFRSVPGHRTCLF